METKEKQEQIKQLLDKKGLNAKLDKSIDEKIKIIKESKTITKW